MKVKNFVLGFGILVVYALVLWQGTQAFYPVPEWNDFCSERGIRPFPVDRGDVANCEFSQELNVKQLACEKAKGHFVYEYDENGCVVDGVCDECQIEYNEARDNYSKNIFIISLIVGVITFIVGYFILSIEPVGSALMASGVWALFYGTVWNWRNFGNIPRFILLLAVLVVLIWLAVRLNKKGRIFKRRKK